MSADKKMSYYSEEELREIADSLDSAIALPVNIEIEADHRVFDMSEVEKILRESGNIFLADCGCRSIHYNCDSPMDTCLAVNVGQDYAEKNPTNHPRKVTIEEALAALLRSHEAGLVHMAYVMKGDEKPFLICSFVVATHSVSFSAMAYIHKFSPLSSSRRTMMRSVQTVESALNGASSVLVR